MNLFIMMLMMQRHRVIKGKVKLYSGGGEEEVLEQLGQVNTGVQNQHNEAGPKLNTIHKKHNRTTTKQEVREEKAGNTDVPNTVKS